MGSRKFMQILVPDPTEKGRRIRINWDPDYGLCELTEENTFPERSHLENAQIVETLEKITLTKEMAQWLGEHMTELAVLMYKYDKDNPND